MDRRPQFSGESGPKSLSVILQPTQAMKNKIPTKSSPALPAKCFPSRRSLAFQSQNPNVLTKIPTYIPPLTSSSHQGLAREGGPAPAMLYRTKARRRARLRPPFVIATRTSRFSTGIHSYLYFICEFETRWLLLLRNASGAVMPTGRLPRLPRRSLRGRRRCLRYRAMSRLGSRGLWAVDPLLQGDLHLWI
jgi:hypothetical protein